MSGIDSGTSTRTCSCSTNLLANNVLLAVFETANSECRVSNVNALTGYLEARKVGYKSLFPTPTFTHKTIHPNNSKRQKPSKMPTTTSRMNSGSERNTSMSEQSQPMMESTPSTQHMRSQNAKAAAMNNGPSRPSAPRGKSPPARPTSPPPPEPGPRPGGPGNMKR